MTQGRVNQICSASRSWVYNVLAICSNNGMIKWMRADYVSVHSIKMCTNVVVLRNESISAPCTF